MVPFSQRLWQSFNLAGIAVIQPVSLKDVQSLRHVVIQAFPGQSFNLAGIAVIQPVSLKDVQSRRHVVIQAFPGQSFNQAGVLSFS